MLPERKHDFLDFMRSMQDWLAQEYLRIQKRAADDPGTAGDQGEENWASVLRNWLPAQYPVVTKGRIIGPTGDTSPQVDVLVLHPLYPLALRDKKLYFAGGLMAAFECKLTLRSVHIKKVFQNAVFIKNLLRRRKDTPYDELHQPIVFGVLAHSQGWKASGEDAVFKIIEALSEQIEKVFGSLYENDPLLCHPRYLVDVVCVADLTTFILGKSIHIGPMVDQRLREIALDAEAAGEDPSQGLVIGYEASWEGDTSNVPGTGLATLISYLTTRFAFEDTNLRSFAEYLAIPAAAGGYSKIFEWHGDVFSDAVLLQLEQGKYDSGLWGKWHRIYYF